MSKEKDKIDSILETYGSDITVLTNTINSSLDSWGEPVIDSSVTRTIKAVKDNNLLNKLSLHNTGRVSSSSSSLIIKAEETFDEREDKIVFSSKTYNILEIQPLELSNEILAQILVIGLD